MPHPGYCAGLLFRWAICAQQFCTNSQYGGISGTVRSILRVKTTLPSTLKVPVPPRPRPLMLFKASVAKPSPSNLKS